jgi:hypothetical protein
MSDIGKEICRCHREEKHMYSGVARGVQSLTMPTNSFVLNVLVVTEFFWIITMGSVVPKLLEF